MIYITEGTGRELVRVQGSRGLVYFLIRGQHYCPCPAYLFSVLGKGELACKHLLATELALATQKFALEIVTDGQLSKLIQDMLAE